jgi:rhamnosyltransferase
MLNLAKLRTQVEGLVVVDNGSTEGQLVMLREASREYSFTLIDNQENLGIAAGLNIGVRWAQAKGYTWVALFDQDSTVPPSFIKTMLHAYEISPRREKVALFVPRYIDSRLGTPLPAAYAADGSLQVAMTSGSLMPISIFRHQGWFEESLFIDGVDYEYCLRLRSNGYSIEECTEAVLLHAPAEFKVCSWLGRRLFSTSNYKAGRRYYRDRNKVWILRRYWAKYPEFVLPSLFNSFKDALKIILAESNKGAKISYMGLGLFDGFLGRMGKRVDL